ncbi:cation transporter [Evansella sp. LMS18]|jgi:cation diffusion facilitator family transporter|uniref:cation diffusion facilitator family transporter n=1 Tax=Evansella sp. LMS18 TaxID=2924033 RepID=UPI0020D1C52C|nr:cation transporter [Evansella sp. LMS18]UTR08623.1 cation transporter [Evansella sp. LMS18]
MNSLIKTEKGILTISVYSAVVFSVAGVLLGILSMSQMILFDGLYSFISVVLSLLSLGAAQYIRKNDFQRFPFGKEIIEPIVLIVKYTVILVLCSGAFISAAAALFTGGRETALGYALLYAVLSAGGCYIVYKFLNRKQQTIRSGFIKAEANQWKMDMYLSFAVLGGFIVTALASAAGFSFITPYMDPVMVLLVSGYFIKVPLTEIVKAFKEVLEMAPDKEIQQQISGTIKKVTAHHNFEESFLRVSKVGSKLYVEVDFVLQTESNVKTVEQQDQVREEIADGIKKINYDKWLSVSFTKDRKWAV